MHLPCDETNQSGNTEVSNNRRVTLSVKQYKQHEVQAKLSNKHVSRLKLK